MLVNRLGLLISCLLIHIAISQDVSVIVNDVEKKSDEFTNEESCSQIISLPRHPDYLTFGMKKSRDLYSMDIARFDLEANEIAFNL